MPSATSAPTTDPADVPTIRSASEGDQPVSDSSASSAPMSHDAPTTPPAPRTNPTRIRWDSDLTGWGNPLRPGPPGPPTRRRGLQWAQMYPMVRPSNHDDGLAGG